MERHHNSLELEKALRRLLFIMVKDLISKKVSEQEELKKVTVCGRSSSGGR